MDIDQGGFSISVIARGLNDQPRSIVASDQDRNLLEYLVSREDGVLNFSETKAEGVIEICGRFGEDIARVAADPAAEAIEPVAEAESNILHLKAGASGE